MTLTEGNTHTMVVPGATLTYDVRPGGSPDTTPLFMTASPMGAAGFGTLAGHFTDRTVVTYDPRGMSRSQLDGPSTDQRLEVHADDARRVLDAVGAGPAHVLSDLYRQRP